MIQFRLKVVQAERNISNNQLSQETGLSLASICKLRNYAPVRLDLRTLNLLCVALDCTPGDLLKRLPET